MKYTVIICDDDVKQASNLALKLRTAAMMESGETPETRIELEIGTIASSYGQVLEYLDQHPLDGGIYLLDIELGQGKDAPNGVDLAEQIKKLDQRAQIVFVTAYNEYMELTYERRIGSVDYINKNNPDLQRRLNETLRDAVHNLDTENFTKQMTFSYRLGRIIKNVNIDDIYYISTTKARTNCG
nr:MULTISPECIES: response regulator [Lactobacillus]